MNAMTAMRPLVPAKTVMGGRALRRSVSNGAVTVAKQLWCPGGQGKLNPTYLDGTLPGDYGFDPLELGAVPANLQRFREAELIHSRWAMLGAAGVIAVEALGFGDWVSAQTASPQTYFGVVIPGGDNITANVSLFTVFLAFAESARQSNTDAQKRLYPGGQFDPMGMSKDPKAFKEAQLKEIKNDPFHVNVGSNPIALPFL